MIFNIISGGGKACTLAITTDPGASVSCVQGSVTFSGTADSSGKVNITLSKSGTWSVTATITKSNPTRTLTRTESVSATSYGQIVNVSIPLTITIVKFSGGDNIGMTMRTYVDGGRSYISEIDTAYSMTAGYNWGAESCSLFTRDKIDLGKFKNIYITCSAPYSTGASANTFYCSDVGTSGSPSGTTYISGISSPYTSTTRHMELANTVTGSYMLGVTLRGPSSDGSAYMSVEEWWIEV